MKSSSPRNHGGGPVILIVGLALLVGAVATAVYKVGKIHIFDHGPSKTELKAGACAVADATKQADTIQGGIDAEKDKRVRTGQNLVDATGKVIAGAPAAVQADPHVALASKLNTKAADALAAAVGPLSADQAAWVDQLVKDATSASEAQRAAAERQLQASDIALRDSQARETQLQTELANARSARDSAQKKLEGAIDDKNSLAALADTMVHWAIWAGIAYVLICWVMPLAAKMFPSLEPIAAAAHAIISPLMAKAKAEAEHLAQDASAALHHTVQLIEAKAPGILADAKTLSDAWITEADGTRQRFDAALRKANVL